MRCGSYLQWHFAASGAQRWQPRFQTGFRNIKLSGVVFLLHYYVDVTDFLKEQIGAFSNKVKKISEEIQTSTWEVLLMHHPVSSDSNF